MAIMPTELDPAGAEPRAILQAADFRDARVLEAGAGDGRLTFKYAREPKWVVGIDTKEADIGSAGRNCSAELREHLRFLCASATALPFPGEMFDIVLLANSL
jgi:ubiquinone/menaquinone biosynthesis C-methylase UbiE